MHQKTLFERASAVAALSIVATLVACGSSTSPKSASSASVEQSKSALGRGGGPQIGGPLSLVSAVEALATERCAHEAKCERIGAGRRFATGDSCRTSLTQEEHKMLTTDVCESGFVESDALRDCLSAIRDATCATETATTCDMPSICSP